MDVDSLGIFMTRIGYLGRFRIGGSLETEEWRSLLWFWTWLLGSCLDLEWSMIVCVLGLVFCG